jgi:hypothetical protein
MASTWLLLIYTVPTEPSRKRAFVWRELKKAGAVYLRDGVCALPECADAPDTLRSIAVKVEEFGGQATLVEGARLESGRAEAIKSQSLAARATEYGEIAREAEQFLVHLQHETEHREFSFAELEELEVDLDKLKRWMEQVRGRDYFGAEAVGPVKALLAHCDEALAAFLEEASGREDTAR